MAKDPAFLFYYKDWLATTKFMSPENRGYFIDLLCYQAEYGTIPQFVINQAIPNTNWVAISDLFQRNKAGYFNSMQRLHLNKRRKFVESRAINGSKGGRPPKASDKPSGKASENLPVNENANGKEDVSPVRKDIAKDLLDNELKITDEDKIDNQGFSWKTGQPTKE